jgi:hypothetical protein
MIFCSESKNWATSGIKRTRNATGSLRKKFFKAEKNAKHAELVGESHLWGK